jgi:hypothetical protein
MEVQTIYQVSGDDFKEAIREAISEEVEQKVYNRFEGTVVDARAACQILNISPDSLYKYVHAGEINCEPRSGRSDYRFRLSELLKADITRIRRKLRYSLNNQSL